MEERPMECFSCKKETPIVYKEIIQGKVVTMKMCSDCPLLQKKLAHTEGEKFSTLSKNQELTCSACHTTLQSIALGGSLGCPKCYETFEEEITQALSNTHLTPLHIGKTPESLCSFDPGKKLESLQVSLSEALERENYERAASIRDEIKNLMEKVDEK